MISREDDLAILRALVAHVADVGVDNDSSIQDAEADAFADMLERLEAGQAELTSKQRVWATEAADRLGVLYGDPAKRNAKVPRGREVELEVLRMPRPLRPPGRRVS